jgi:glutathione S-transferase
MSAVLYSFPFSCALAVELVLRQHGVPFERVEVPRGPGRKLATDVAGPKRKVPALVLDGVRRTEVVAILHELDRRFVPERPADEARQHLEWLSFVATELHQQVLGPWFDPETPEVAKCDVRDRLLPPVLDDLRRALDGRETLLGGEPSGADAYLLWGLLLVRAMGSLDPALGSWCERMTARPWVAEGVREARRGVARPASTPSSSPGSA